MDFTFSNTLSKGSVYESDSIFKAYQDDALSRLADGVRPEAISNEEIRRGDEILDRVEDDAIHGGMGSVWRVHHSNSDIAEGREEAEFTNRRSTFMTIVLGRKPSAKRSGLEAKLPAAGLFEDDHALEVDSDRRWMLIYRRPYTDQENDSFFLCDTDFYGHMPDYVIARAVSTMEQLSVQQKRRAALDRASKALSCRSPECFDALMEAYALFPDNPDEEWTALSDRAGAFGVRKALLGTHKGAALDERALEARDEARGYPGDDPEYELFAACKLDITREGCGWIGELDGETVVCWPEDAIRENTAALAHYDRARRAAYLCSGGVFSAWDCAKRPTARLGQVLYGVPLPDSDPEEWHPALDFEPFLPGGTEHLWAVEPTYLMLNRAENATVAILRGRVLNVYGADRISEAFTGVKGFAAVQAIDLTTITRLRQIFYSESSDLIELEEEKLTFAECNLAGVSADGTVMAWNRYTIGAELWAFPEPGVILTHSVSGFEIDQVRRDGNAVLTKLEYSSTGDTMQEILLEWQYGARSEDGESTKPKASVKPEGSVAADANEKKAPAISPADQQELEHLEKALQDAEARVKAAETAYEHADVRYNSPEQEQMSRRIYDLRNQISRLGFFGRAKKTQLHAEQVLLERKVADLFIDRREAKEKLEAVQKTAEDARQAFEAFRKRLFSEE